MLERESGNINEDYSLWEDVGGETVEYTRPLEVHLGEFVRDSSQ
jgi:hypothetical protein